METVKALNARSKMAKAEHKAEAVRKRKGKLTI